MIADLQVSNSFPIGASSDHPSAGTISKTSAQEGRMSQSPLPKPQTTQGAKPTHIRKAGVSQKRRRLAKMSLGVFAVGALITVVAVLAIGFTTAHAPVGEGGASRIDPNSVATIVMRSGTNGCQQRSFNNQTGQISDQTSPCHNDVVLDAKGVPIPTGTIHTLNSISNSFK